MLLLKTSLRINSESSEIISSTTIISVSNITLLSFLFIYLFILPAISSPSAIKGHGIFVHPFGVNWPIAGESSFYTSFND